MKTTMVAGEGVWSPGKGGSAAPRGCSVYCAGAALTRRVPAGRMPAAPSSLPPSLLIRTGGRMLGQAKTLRRSCLRAGISPSRGRLRGGRRGQSQLRPPGCSAAGEGNRGPLLWPPAGSPRPSRLLPRTAQTTGICSSRLGASISPTPPSWTPGTPQDPAGHSSATNQLLPQQCCQLGGTGRNWEDFPPWAMTQHRQQCHTAHPSLSPVPPPGPCPIPGREHTGQRVFVLRDRDASRSQGLAALGENQVWDQSNQ